MGAILSTIGKPNTIGNRTDGLSQIPTIGIQNVCYSSPHCIFYVWKSFKIFAQHKGCRQSECKRWQLWVEFLVCASFCIIDARYTFIGTNVEFWIIMDVRRLSKYKVYIHNIMHGGVRLCMTIVMKALSFFPIIQTSQVFVCLFVFIHL